jgi:hypothetical protein
LELATGAGTALAQLEARLAARARHRPRANA